MRRLAIGVILTLAVAAAAVFWFRSGVERPNVLLVTIDTLRADHLGSYGYPRATSPHLDALAASGAAFDRAFAQATLSGPSHATILTSLHVPTHGVISNAVRLDENNLSVAEVLQAAGYDTAMLVNHKLLRGKFQFDQGFDHVEVHNLPSHAPDHDHADDEDDRVAPVAIFDAALAWLGRTRSAPFFLWLHLQHTHQSYEPPSPFDRMFIDAPPASPHDLRCLYTIRAHGNGEIELTGAERDWLVAQYDGEIAYVDSQLGRIFEALDSSGAADNTIVVVTADHGELLFDGADGRKVGHGRSRHDPALRVPLIVGGSVGAGGRRIGEMVGLIDVAPTLLELAGIPAPGSFDGTSLVPLIEGRGGAVRDVNYSWTFHGDGFGRMSRRDARFKLICDKGREELPDCELYDLDADPLEQIDLSGEPDFADALVVQRDDLMGWFADSIREGHEMNILVRDKKALELLQRAGYLEDRDRAEPDEGQ